MTSTATAAPGTCKLQGCPGWGTHDVPSPSVKIGAGTWDDYTRTDHCLGYPQIKAGSAVIHILCSLGGPWAAVPRMTLTPDDMAQLVDQHRAGCANRSPR